jgi:L,D-transpeptidase ErfK/SrfK
MAAALLLAAATTVLSGCALFEAPEWARRDDGSPRRGWRAEELPIDSQRFVLAPGVDVVGEVQVIRARHEDTFVDIARAYDLGFDELEQANPDVDPWLPGAGTRIILPTQFVLPDGPRTGIVLNIGVKRLFYFPVPAPGEPAVVVTHPVGIGREGWGTPVGLTRISSKVKDPVWVVPASIRKEHAEAGDPLPARVPAGPDNPLGHRALRLALPSYLIHGTNRPAGIGMRVSHGCIQLYPEDIETLFDQVAVGTPVRIVNQPQKLGWLRGNLYLEAHPPLEDDGRDWDTAIAQDLAQKLRARPPGNGLKVDDLLIASTKAEGRGFPVPVLAPGADAASVAARARAVRNIVVHDTATPATGAGSP